MWSRSIPGKAATQSKIGGSEQPLAGRGFLAAVTAVIRSTARSPNARRAVNTWDLLGVAAAETR
jgi:hypothetical protein